MRNSALSGFFAALAGLFGKLGADSDSNALQYLQTQCPRPLSSLSESCIHVTALVRVFCLTLMLGANALMLSCFVKGLQETDSLTATVTSAAVNFMLSALGGWVCFQEVLPTRWFLGAFSILLGMVFILHGDDGAAENKAKEKRK
ncbi:hypothetical protein PsorP6_017059 [Peronosclerospora sorghi]|uniref:Uncharacterized protein n=1 Tax=Peronosclerospora sorghi TaxID=230839 RepID=A0ACC0WCK5_9STRA|nr:hypothetical protein PsorP6_017059 [Peronosclerospora sorghi]